MSEILDSINSPDDLKKLPYSKLEQLASEIRAILIERASLNGGHLASNLGAVELTIALHRVFTSPKDKIVWDVGHQSYTHKLLTGRRDSFATIRNMRGYQDSLLVMRALTMPSELDTLVHRSQQLWVWH